MADTPLRANADPSWQQLNTLADTQAPEIQSVFLAAIRALLAGVVLRELLSAFTYRDPTRALAALNLDTLIPSLTASLTPVLEQTARTSADAAATQILRDGLAESGASLTLRLTGGLPTTEITDWARQYGAMLARDLANETRYALQGIIATMMANGTAPEKAARTIELVIGLTQRGAAALLRYEDALAAEGIVGTRLDALVARYARRLLRQRARIIARTESITAANRGNLEVWLRNVRDGVLNPDRWEKEWFAVGDPRTCPDCEDMDGQRARIDQPFISPRYGETWGPALHPNCRCTVALVRRTGSAPRRAA